MQFLCWEGRNLEFPRKYFVRFSYLNLILPHYVSLRWEKRGRRWVRLIPRSGLRPLDTLSMFEIVLVVGCRWEMLGDL